MKTLRLASCTGVKCDVPLADSIGRARTWNSEAVERKPPALVVSAPYRDRIRVLGSTACFGVPDSERRERHRELASGVGHDDSPRARARRRGSGAAEMGPNEPLMERARVAEAESV